MSSFVLIAIGILQIATGLVLGQFTCPGDGDYPEPNSCRLYWRCRNNVPLLVSCPSSSATGQLHFDPNRRICDVAHLAGCAATACQRQVTSIGERTYVNTRGTAVRDGAWMTDQAPLDEASASRFWILEGIRSDRLLQFSNIDNLNNNITESTLILPFECMGTGSLVANGRFYCHIYGTKYIMGCSINTGNCVERAIPDIGLGPNEEYSLTGLGNFIDFQHDERGIWVLYASIFNNFNVIIEGIDPENLNVIESYNTGIPKRFIGNAFIVCGNVYGIERADSSSSYVRYKYDRATNTTTALSNNQLPFNHALGCGSSAWITQLSYNWVEERLLVWNCGVQEKYDLTFAY